MFCKWCRIRWGIQKLIWYTADFCSLRCHREYGKAQQQEVRKREFQAWLCRPG